MLSTLGASSLGNILTGRGINRAGDEVVRAGYGCRSLNSSKSKKGRKINKMDFNAASSFN